MLLLDSSPFSIPFGTKLGHFCGIRVHIGGFYRESQKPSGSDPDPASDSLEGASSDSSCSDSDPSEESSSAPSNIQGVVLTRLREWGIRIGQVAMAPQEQQPQCAKDLLDSESHAPGES